MPRYLNDHRVEGLNDQLDITAVDEPGAGGACHDYEIEGGDWSCRFCFQKGPVDRGGPNGISNESLLAIVLDRLRGFQTGGFACRENALAMTKLEEAMHWLHHRTRQRLERGVEGTNEP